MVEVDLRAWLPCWLLRLLVLLAGVGCLIVLDVAWPAGLVVAAALAVAVVRPGNRSGALFCLVVGLVRALFPAPPVSPVDYALLALAPAVLALGSVIEALPATARIEGRVLRPAAIRYVVIQLISQPVLVATALLQRQQLGLLPLAVAAAVVVSVTIWLLVPRLSR